MASALTAGQFVYSVGMNDAVVYTRLSAEREGSTETLEDQERVCRQLAAAKGLNVVAVFAEGAGVSAFSGVARPALDALHDHVRANRGTTVIAWELSRLTRKLTDLSGWVSLIEDHQLRIVTPQLDTGEGGLILLTIMAAMAHEESATKSSRVQAGKRRQRAAGRYMSSRAPAGYRLSEEVTGGLEIDPESAETVREAARLYLEERLSLRGASVRLNNAGRYTQRGESWEASQLRRVFLNPIIAGLVLLDDGTLSLCAGLTEGVVSVERWAELRQRIDSRKATRTARRPPTALLTAAAAVLRCGTCEGPMTTARRQDKSYYQCANRHRMGTSGCAAGVMIGADVVERFAILQCLYEIVDAQAAHNDGNPARLDDILSTFARVERPEDAGIRADLLAARAEIEVRRDVILRSYLAGKLDASTYESGLDSITLQLSTLDADIAAMPAEDAFVPLPVDPHGWFEQLSTGELLPGDMPAALLAACGSLEVARNLLAAALGTITVMPGAAGLKSVERLRYEAPQAI